MLKINAQLSLAITIYNARREDAGGGGDVDAGRNAVASDRAPGTPDRDPAIPIDSSHAVISENDQLLARIHAAVVAGELNPRRIRFASSSAAGSRKRAI